jgi:AraC-like DNA-binding protein
VGSQTVNDFDVWQAGVTSTFVPLRSDPIGQGVGFRGALSTRRFGKVRVSRVRATPHAVWRSERELADGLTNEVKISFVMAGTAAIEQNEVRSLMRAGDAALYDCDHRYRLTMDQPFDQLVLQLDRRELEDLVTVPAGRLVTFQPQNMFMQCLRSVARDLSDLDESVAADATAGETILLGEKMLEFLALAISGSTACRVAGGPTRRQLYVRAVQHIRRHIGDPALSPAAVARDVGLSRASLYQLFAGEGQTVAQFIIAERLELARRELGDPRAADRSITQIAMACGFKSAAHFSRRFAARFDLSPTEARRLATTDGPYTRVDAIRGS